MTTPRPTTSRGPAVGRSRAAHLVGLALACTLLVACGDDGSPSSSSSAPTSAATSSGTSGTGGTAAPTGNDEVCDDYAAFRDSITALTDVDVVASGTSGLQAAVDDLRTSLQALRSSASDVAADEVTAVQSALDDLQTAISDGGAGGIVTAAATVVTSGNALLQRLDDLDCSASASPTP